MLGRARVQVRSEGLPQRRLHLGRLEIEDLVERALDILERQEEHLVSARVSVRVRARVGVRVRVRVRARVRVRTRVRVRVRVRVRTRVRVT